MQSPKTILTIAAFGAALLSSPAIAQTSTPSPHFSTPTQGAPLHTFTYSLTPSNTSGTSAGKNSAVNGQALPDMHKFVELGKTSVSTATVKLGEITTDAEDAGKNAAANGQARPDMHKFVELGKASVSTATVKLGGISDSCHVVNVLEESAYASKTYAAGRADIRTQATASAQIVRDVTDRSNVQVLGAELAASLSEHVSVFGLAVKTGRISVATSHKAPQGSCGVVSSRSAGARIELGGTTVSILREKGDALMQTSIEQITLRDRVLFNAGPVAVLVAPLVSTRADVSIEAGSLGRQRHLGMYGFLQIQSSGTVTTKVVGGKPSKDASKMAELDFDTTRNLIDIHEIQAAAEGEIILEVGQEHRSESLGA